VGRDGSRRLFLFEVAGDRFAVDLELVREVVAVCRLSRPPGTPAILRGFLALDGQSIPVLDPRRLFGGPAEDAAPQAHAHLVILARTPTALALLVDRALGLEEIAAGAWQPLSPGHSFNDCAEGDARIGSDAVHVLSAARLLLDEERRRIAELQSLEQARLEQLGERSA
jgi:purine-binding chemotaxis protein CheW